MRKWIQPTNQPTKQDKGITFFQKVTIEVKRRNTDSCAADAMWLEK